jgi:hypothetical protein
MGGRVQCPERLCYVVPKEARGTVSLGEYCEGGKLTMGSERSVTDDLSIGTDIVGQSVQMVIPVEDCLCLRNICTQVPWFVLIGGYVILCLQHSELAKVDHDQQSGSGFQWGAGFDDVPDRRTDPF